MVSVQVQRFAAVRALLAGAGACLMVTGAGCAGQNRAYSWSHPAGGEYLFAFDSQKCGAGAGEEFFTCMKSRGYFLVDPDTGQPLADAGEPLVLMAPGYTQAGR
jgi:hypothetical protein